jgi:hypothetical protein
MEMTEDEQELFDERVAIMVIDGKVSEGNAISYAKKYIRELRKKKEEEEKNKNK